MKEVLFWSMIISLIGALAWILVCIDLELSKVALFCGSVYIGVMNGVIVTGIWTIIDRGR